MNDRRDFTGLGALYGLILLLAAMATPALGVQVDGLYQAEVPVAGQEAAQGNEAIGRAFGKMLIKVTGNRNIANRQELTAEFAKAPRYVQQYRYRLDAEQPADGADVQPEGAEAAEPKRYLQVVFDEQAVNRFLRQSRLPVWGDNRPGGLVWLGEESKSRGRRLTGAESSAWSVLESVARQRGVPLIVPLMDLEDQSRLQVADLWGDFERNISGASHRYSPDFVLTGRLTRVASDLWRSRWTLFQGEKISSWSNDGRSRNQLLGEGVQYASDLLANRFAPIGGASELTRVRLRVEGVGSLREYAGVGGFLSSQSAVARMDLSAVEANAVIYELQVRGGLEVLEQGLALGGLIEPDGDAVMGEEAVAENVDLFYRLRQ
ncbi:hypothetical protein BOW51_11865 [Solemya velesiana gill symbiont]|uniref:DUF2066 domain-containing protein n=2 Tax=Solemya velesiana gill symbiont TaxID=1918948 RepID=A0A1T2KPM2_9GAMM|nr:hypothetical protein BOW51_11865 [Solemya velesiana gill symbiont]